MDISKREPSTDKEMKRRGAFFATLSKLLKGGNIEVNSMFAKEGYGVGDAPGESVLGIFEQQDDPFGFGQTAKAPVMNVFGGILAMIGSIVPTTDDAYALGTTDFAWEEVVATNPFIVVSDERIKKDIEDSEPGLEHVLKLRPVSYRLKKAANDAPKMLGFVAQEVKEVIPEAVNGSAETRYGLATETLIPVLVKAIQEQQKQITQLTARVEKLEKNQ
jgi:hypothetical protein